MSYRIAVCFLLLFWFPMITSFAAEEDEPTFADKKLSYWLDLLENGKDEKARRKGILGLVQIGHDASRKVTPALVAAVRQDKDAKVRVAAIRGLGAVTSKALQTAREDKREESLRFDSVRDALVTALRTEKEDAVRQAAAQSLGDLGPQARVAVGALAQALKDSHSPTVLAAAQTLRRLGRDARDAQVELQALLANDKAEVEARIDAAVCLGQIRPDVTQALPVMRETLANGKIEERIRRAVADSLGRLGRDAADASPTLAEVLVAKETSPDLRLAVVAALDQFGAEAKAAIPALVKTVGDPELIRLMGEQARFIRCLAMHSLGRMGKDLGKDRSSAIAALLKATDDPIVEVNVSALETLGALAGEGLGDQADQVVKRMDAVLLREGRKTIRDAAQAARDRIRPPKKP